MQAIYPFLLIIHLICAIIFIGYLFFDVVIFPSIQKTFGEEISSKAAEGISKRGTKIMPICVLILAISGGMMVSNYIGGDLGYFHSTFQKILILKIFLACLIFAMIIVSLSYKFIFKKPSPIGKIIHPVALTLGIIIVVLAKLMFYV
ncbi:copper resistance protein CopD [Helicobacter sp. 11S03491-1]|uniref:copper resistance protein CopD n=1 Tax=Helicobacter sp. 11S03491-1 TaxID=1476196 RepID=UPI000BA59181|nr:copper resistance protein CopD [Helicobacter sp. 11S03491-1]PAF43802.1 copper resistance protein CopD [Helicobacter sp. 11S03491-1]